MTFEISTDEARRNITEFLETPEPASDGVTDGGRVFRKMAQSVLENPESVQEYTDRYNAIARLQSEIDAGF